MRFVFVSLNRPRLIRGLLSLGVLTAGTLAGAWFLATLWLEPKLPPVTEGHGVWVALSGRSAGSPAGSGPRGTGGESGACPVERLLFEISDPRGDDFGPGFYTYPTDRVFSANPGLFDLLGFRIIERGDDLVYELSFAKVTNPWDAPEGYFHQLIDIYIDGAPGGRIEPVEPGLPIRFPRAAAWEARIKVIPWGQGRVWRLVNGQLLMHEGIVASEYVRREGARRMFGREPARHVIRVRVPKALLPEHDRVLGYYVLVGSYDALSRDDYRPVEATATPWTFGGGYGDRANPPVIDLLAPKRGEYSQAFQLSSSPAVLQPVQFVPPASRHGKN